MGKKKGYDDLGVMKKREVTRDIAEQMGIDTKDYSLFGYGRNDGGVERGSFEDLEQAVADRMANDYDVRRSIEAAKLSPKNEKQEEKYGKLPGGISDIGEAYDVHRFMKKTHKKQLGNGGSFSSANDYANISDYYVNKDRDAMLAKIDEGAKSNQSASEEATAEAKEIVLSDHMQKAKARVDQFEGGNTPVYNPEAMMAQKTGQKSIFADSARKSNFNASASAWTFVEYLNMIDLSFPGPFHASIIVCTAW